MSDLLETPSMKELANAPMQTKKAANGCGNIIWIFMKINLLPTLFPYWKIISGIPSTRIS